MNLTTSEKRVYGMVALLLAGFLAAAALGYAYPALLWLGFTVPVVALIALVSIIAVGRCRGGAAVTAETAE